MAAVAVVDGGSVTNLDQSLATRGALPVGPPPSLVRDSERNELARQIVGRWDEGARILADRRRSYWQNLAFYLGHQWLWWSAQRQMVMPLAQDFSPLGKGKARIVINRYGPNIINVVNRLTRSQLAFEVNPSDGGDNIVGGAKLGAKLLEAARVEQSWDRTRFNENLGKLLGGTSFVSIEWDGSAGKALPQYDQASHVFVGTGDTRLSNHNITEAMLEPGVRDQGDARYWISCLSIPVGTAAEHYGLDWLPRADADAPSGSLYESLLDGSGRQRGDNLCNVYTYYERPHRKSPGVYACVINGVIVHRGPWPFPFECLNVRAFRQKPVDGKWYGHTFGDDAWPIQVAYNQARSIISEHMKVHAKIRLAAPQGAFNPEDLAGGTNDVLWYAADGFGSKPEYVVPPNMPRWMGEEANNLRDELDNTMHVSDVSRGIGYSRAAAQALTFLAEQDDSGLGHMVREEQNNWQALGKMYLELAGAKVTETRETSLPLSKTVTEKIRWTGRELQGQTNVVVPTEAVTPQNSAARMANAKDLWDRKIITDPRQYARMSNLPPDEFEQLLDPDSAKANDENLRMMLGQPVLPEDFDDHAVHIAEHNDRLRKTDSYLYAAPEIRAIVDDHIMYHQHKATNEVARQQKLGEQSAVLPSVPQADAPPGSDVPPGEQETMARMGAMAALGAAPDGGALGGAPAANTASSRPALPAPGGAT